MGCGRAPSAGSVPRLRQMLRCPWDLEWGLGTKWGKEKGSQPGLFCWGCAGSAQVPLRSAQLGHREGVPLAVALLCVRRGVPCSGSQAPVCPCLLLLAASVCAVVL